jgi:putative transposase
VNRDNFNLPAPPGFRGLHPNVPLTMYVRHLPHWRQRGATYFVTFRLADSLPQARRDQLQQWRAQWEREHPPPRSSRDWEAFARQFTRATEAWMDEGNGECVFRSPELAELMSVSFLHFQDLRYSTICFVVMPNHCHVVVRPLGEFDLETILNSWKGYVGHEVNRRLGRRGPLWQDESYDRIIRDEEHLYRVVQYIGNNPAKAGLPRLQWHRWLHPQWEASGWGFRDELT